MSVLRAFGLLPLLCLLAGCWQSERPLIDGRRAARPPIAGTYHSADPKEQGDGPMRITLGADGGFVFDQGHDKEKIRAFLAPLRGDWFILQWMVEKPGSRPEGSLYQLLRVGEGRLELYDAPCDDELGHIAGMTRENTTCTFARFDALREAARRALGRIQADKGGDEPAVLIRE